MGEPHLGVVNDSPAIAPEEGTQLRHEAGYWDRRETGDESLWHGPDEPERSQRVRFVETGTTYASMAAAARAVGVSRPTLSQAVSTGCRADGFRWEIA